LGLHAKFYNAFSDLVNKFSEEGMQEEIIEKMHLYCWVRSLTLILEAPEAYFEKINRNWLKIFDDVSGYAYDLTDIHI
jgi:hypothetical protein